MRIRSLERGTTLGIIRLRDVQRWARLEEALWLEENIHALYGHAAALFSDKMVMTMM